MIGVTSGQCSWCVVNGILLKKVEQEVEISFGPKRAPQICSHGFIDSAIALFENRLVKKEKKS
jgi:hypothetical protein